MIATLTDPPGTGQAADAEAHVGRNEDGAGDQPVQFGPGA
jgi:hypothetical protein